MNKHEKVNLANVFRPLVDFIRASEGFCFVSSICIHEQNSFFYLFIYLLLLFINTCYEVESLHFP